MTIAALAAHLAEKVAPQTGAEVRDYHIGIKGVDKQGRRYSALNPDVFYWAHATFFKSTLLAAEKFGGGISESDKRQLFDEHVGRCRVGLAECRPEPVDVADAGDHARQALGEDVAQRPLGGLLALVALWRTADVALSASGFVTDPASFGLRAGAAARTFSRSASRLR